MRFFTLFRTYLVCFGADSPAGRVILSVEESVVLRFGEGIKAE